MFNINEVFKNIHVIILPLDEEALETYRYLSFSCWDPDEYGSSDYRMKLTDKPSITLDIKSPYDS